MLITSIVQTGLLQGEPATTVAVPTFTQINLRESIRRSGLARTLAQTYGWRILVTYGSYNLENLLRLTQPFVLSLAIQDLLQSSYTGLWEFAAVYLIHAIIGTFRRIYDTRAFTAIYADLATWLVMDQREREVDVSRVAARSALSREFVGFFEKDVPDVMWVLYSVVGALTMLAFQDWILVLLCGLLLIPAGMFNMVYGRWIIQLNRRLNDQVECEVDVIAEESVHSIRRHYGLLAHWRIRLSNCDALNFGVMELFAVLLLSSSLIRCCSAAGTNMAQVLGIFPYVAMFTLGLDSVPTVIQQVGRLRDISQRMREANV